MQPVAGGFLVAQLFAKELVRLDGNLEPINGAPAAMDTVKSPHFLAEHPKFGILVSDGWGRYVYSLLHEQWSRNQNAPDSRLHAPHGVCVDDKGRIVVADSLHSRLVRMQNMDSGEWEIFADNAKKVSYGRQLECLDDGLWLANSYENRDGLNPGRGGNILRIANFESGEVEVLASN